MWPIVLEAVGALALFVFLVWWTMFSGRRHGELHGDAADPVPQATPPAAPGPDQVGERGGNTNEPG